MGFIATNIDKICGKCNFFNPKCCTNEKPYRVLLTGVLVQLVRIHACHAWGHGFESRTHRILGGLAQLARASALHAEGQRFESVILHSRQSTSCLAVRSLTCCTFNKVTRRASLRNINPARKCRDIESKQGQTVDALALGGDEGRDKLR